VPGVSGVAAQTKAGQVRLTWPSAGIGMRYRIYLGSVSGSVGYLRTVSAPRVTLTGLAPGRTCRVQVVPESIHSVTGSAADISVRIP
jgi:hypothetical protein